MNDQVKIGNINMEKKLKELNVVLEGLVLPNLPEGTKLIAKRNYEFHKESIYIEVLKEIPGRLCGNYHCALSGIMVGKEDWFFACKRYELPTVIAATELVDIAVEKVLGMSCGYKIGN